MNNPLMGGMPQIGANATYPYQQSQTPQQPTEEYMRREVSSIKGNPVSYLRQRGYNIPDGMTDPRQITQYMLQNGMIGGGRLQQVMRMIGAVR